MFLAQAAAAALAAVVAAAALLLHIVTSISSSRGITVQRAPPGRVQFRFLTIVGFYANDDESFLESKVAQRNVLSLLVKRENSLLLYPLHGINSGTVHIYRVPAELLNGSSGKPTT